MNRFRKRGGHPSASNLPARKVLVLAAAVLLTVTGCAAKKKIPLPVDHWGACDYEAYATRHEPRAVEQIDLPMAERSKDAGVLILDYASACLAAGHPDKAQQFLYEAILLTNDLTLNESQGEASLIFDEAMKTWQGEAYERGMIELLHGICLMKIGDYHNARVAFDRAIATDRFSKGALVGVEGDLNGKNDKAEFVPNEQYAARGGSVFQQDFLAAYILRTLAYLQQGRTIRAEESWQEGLDVFRDMCLKENVLQFENPTGLTWTRPDGRYQYPHIYIAPMLSENHAAEALFDLTLEDLKKINLVVIAATGSRPRKVRTGISKMGGDVKFVHDGYLPSAEVIASVGVMVDGHYRGDMCRCLDLYTQAAGRGPSLKDLAQLKKEQVEMVGEFLQEHGSFGLQYVGMIIRAVNQEKADIRQWDLLPNALHVWLGRVEPGSRRISCLPIGSNAASLELSWENVITDALLTQETGYVRTRQSARRNGDKGPWAVRHTRTVDLEIADDNVSIVFVAEKHNALVNAVSIAEPKVYELQPRHLPPGK